jgi:hypothetical protein
MLSDILLVVAGFLAGCAALVIVLCALVRMDGEA